MTFLRRQDRWTAGALASGGQEKRNNMYILRTKPVFKETIWGGRRLKDDFGYDIPGDHTGECWAVSAHPDGEGSIVNGEYAGTPLSGLWSSHPELFGNYPLDRFPLLTKIIDAQADLSIQVHPDDTYAAEHENGSLGKMECWYIIDCVPGATIVIGHHAKTREELRDMVNGGRWKELIREVPIRKGDFFQIDPGTVHAIKAGTLILESQQSSDITYRLYDYDRLQNGKPRPLHLEKSLDVIEVPFVERRAIENGDDGSWMRLLYSCKYYKVWKGVSLGKEKTADGAKTQAAGAAKTHTADTAEIIPSPEFFLIGSVLSGEAVLGDEFFRKGDHFIIPSGYGPTPVTGDAEFIFSSPV